MADVSGHTALREQIRLVAWLRWRVLRNSISNKNRRLDLIGLIFSGFFSLLFVIGVTFGFYFVTKSLFEKHREPLFGLVFLALLVWWQAFPILLAGFAPQFPFRTLLRFPVKLSAFYIIGMAYGLADSAALAALLWMLAMLAATLVAQPAAAPALLLVCLLFTTMNVTIERLLGAWVEKLLAKRKTREVFFTLFILAMVSLQFLNPLLQRYGHALVPIMTSWVPYLWLLPSSFAGDAVAQFASHHWGTAVVKLCGLAVYTGIFTLLLWMRYTQLYSGEELSEGVAPGRKEKRAALSAEDARETLTFFSSSSPGGISQRTSLSEKKHVFVFWADFPADDAALFQRPVCRTTSDCVQKGSSAGYFLSRYDGLSGFDLDRSVLQLLCLRRQRNPNVFHRSCAFSGNLDGQKSHHHFHNRV